MPSLTVSRRPGERIFIGEDICITFVECVGRKTVVRVSAPSNVIITRHELLHPDEVQDRVKAICGKEDHDAERC